MSNYPCGFSHDAYEAQFSTAETLTTKPTVAVCKFTGKLQVVASMEQYFSDDDFDENQMEYFHVSFTGGTCPQIAIELCDVLGEQQDLVIKGDAAIAMLENAIKLFRSSGL